jgi:uncharacterized protein YwbE
VNQFSVLKKSTGARCEYAGARLIAMLGKKPSIQSGGKIQIVVENGIRRAGTQDLETAETLTGVFSTVTLHPSAVSARRENCAGCEQKNMKLTHRTVGNFAGRSAALPHHSQQPDLRLTCGQFGRRDKNRTRGRSRAQRQREDYVQRQRKSGSEEEYVALADDT